jgi:hypothetical protein
LEGLHKASERRRNAGADVAERARRLSNSKLLQRRHGMRRFDHIAHCNIGGRLYLAPAIVSDL